MTIFKREYKCGICGGDVQKDPCPTRGMGLGKWRCVRRGCTKPATSINQAGSMNKGVDNNGRPFVTSPMNTGRSPHAVVVVKLVKLDKAA